MKICPEPSCKKTYADSAVFCSVHGTVLRSVSALETGDTIREWIIVKQLGIGGFGTVYHVRHSILQQRQRALKVLRPEYARDPLFLRMLQSEAITTDRIQHPNVVKIHDVAVAEDGSPFIVMEYVIGRTLAEILRPRPMTASGTGEPLDVQTVVNIGYQVCGALEAAHQARIIHRDIKPQNIMISPGKNGLIVKVLDFGIAKLKEAEATSTVTRSMVVFTPQYASPEQHNGLPGSQLDGRSDIYSLGIVMYEALTGLKPFSGDSIEELKQAQLHSEPVSPTQRRPDLKIPEAVANVVLKAIAKEPDGRFQTAKDMAAALQHSVNGPDFQAPATAPVNIQVDSGEELQGGERIGGRYRIIDEIGSAPGKIRKTQDAQLIAGKYRIIEEIGAASGTSFPLDVKAYRSVDISAAPPGECELILAGNSVPEQQFLTSAATAQQIQHENAAAILDVGVTPGGAPFLVQEHARGRSLSSILNDVRKSYGGGLEPARAIHIAHQMCAALVAAHKTGSYHCDIRPANVLIENEADEALLIKIKGFGLPPHFGTFPYCSPEQLAAIHVNQEVMLPVFRPSSQSDIYSLGVVLHEMLTGLLPFPAKSVSELRKLQLNTRMLLKPVNPDVRFAGIWDSVTTDPERVRRRIRLDICHELVWVVSRALKPASHLRYASAEEMLQALHEAAQSQKLFTIEGEKVLESWILKSSQSTRNQKTAGKIASATFRPAIKKQRRKVDIAMAVASAVGAFIFLALQSGLFKPSDTVAILLIAIVAVVTILWVVYQAHIR